MQLPSFFRNYARRWLFNLVPLLLLALFLYILSVARRLAQGDSLAEIAGTFIVIIVILTVTLLWERWASSVRAFIRKRWRSSRPEVRRLCLLIFFPVFSLYFLTGKEAESVPATLEVGIIAVAAALGGLVLNAGLNLGGEKGRELIHVAQKFIAVVILMLIFLPTLYILDLAGDIDISSFEPDNPDAWFGGAMFGIAAASFFTGVAFFIIALVDLIYAIVGLGGVGSVSCRKCESPDKSNQYDGCGNNDASASG